MIRCADGKSLDSNIQGYERHHRVWEREVQSDRCFRFASRSGYGVAGSIRVVADKLNASVDYHLRGVNFVGVENTRVIILSCAECRRRIWISPAQMIPIINVLRKRDHFRAWNGLSLVESSEKLVGRRTTRATFRGKQLDENRNPIVTARRITFSVDHRQLSGLSADQSRGDQVNQTKRTRERYP